MKQAIIFDIDGTLADIRHRLHFIQRTPKDWDAFFKAMEYDEPIKDMCDVCRMLMVLSGMATRFGILDVEVIFCTGRPDNYREMTEGWLRKNVMDSDVKLYMRKAEDHRPDYEVKEELLAQIRADGYEPWYVFEDRSQTVGMWRRNGIRCFQVAAGDF